MNGDAILNIFKQSGALLEGHFQLTSGLHSPNYFQCAKVLQYPGYAEAVCADLVAGIRSQPIDVVIAPAVGGIVVAQELGRQIAAAQGSAATLRVLFTERKENVMQLRRGFEIRKGEHVLVCEDVITTGGSVKEVVQIVRACGGDVAGVAAIVDRSGGTVDFGVSLSAAMTMSVIAYKPEECPLCKSGAPIEKPGSRGATPS